jgi:hypothetical protein
MRRWTTAAATAVFLLAGCSSSSGVTGGGSAGGHDSQTVKGKAYVDAMMADFSSGEQSLTTAQAQCMADKMVDVVGVSSLEKAGVTPADITNNTLVFGSFTPTDQQAESMLDGVFTCVDFGKVFADEIVGASGNSVPIDKLQCVSNAITTDSQFRTYMKQTLIGLDTQATIPTDGLIPMMLQVFQTCGVDPAALGS